MANVYNRGTVVENNILCFVMSHGEKRDAVRQKGLSGRGRRWGETGTRMRRWMNKQVRETERSMKEILHINSTAFEILMRKISCY